MAKRRMQLDSFNCLFEGNYSTESGIDGGRLTSLYVQKNAHMIN